MTMSRKNYKAIAKAIGESFESSSAGSWYLSWPLLAVNLAVYFEADNEKFDSDKFTNEVDHQHSIYSFKTRVR